MSIATAMSESYPVQLGVTPQLTGRNRLTVGFRLILAIPHWLLVGGVLAFSFGASGAGDFDWRFGWSSEGILGLAAFVVSIVAWFALLFTRRHPRGMWDFVRWYMTWRVNALAYIMLLRGGCINGV